MREISLHVTTIQPGVLQSIKVLLKNEKNILVNGIYNSFNSTIKHLHKKTPCSSEVLFVDDSSFNKREVVNFLERSREDIPFIKTIINTDSLDELYLRKLVDKDVKGILHREGYCSYKEEMKIIEAIKIVHSGCNCFDNLITSIIKPCWSKGSYDSEYEKGEEKYFSPLIENYINRLSRREKEIMLFIAKGMKNNEIAGYLFIGTRTVETHKTNIMHKLKLKSTSELVLFAVRNEKRFI